MPADKKSEKNAVGYGKPPQQTRFKPGHSGNPKGRPRGTRNLKTELAEELQESIVIHEGGKRKRVSKQRAIIKRLVEKSLTGDIRAARELLLLSLRVLAPEIENEEFDDLSDHDHDLIADFLARSSSKPARKSTRARKKSGVRPKRKTPPASGSGSDAPPDL